jgi:hypothetical protein
MMILDDEVLVSCDILAEPVQIEAVMHVEWEAVAMCSRASHRSDRAVIWGIVSSAFDHKRGLLTKVR